MTTVPVGVVRVFTDAEDRFGNPLGIIDGALVPPSDRLRVAAGLGYSEIVYVDDAGTIRARAFAPGMGVEEDEATGSAVTQLTAQLARDLHVIQGAGSHLHTTWQPPTHATVGGRVIPAESRTITI